MAKESSIMSEHQIPKKFKKNSEKFISSVGKEIANPAYKSMSAFPKDVRFNSQNKDEDVVLLLRQDPASLIWKYLTIILFFLAPLLFIAVLQALGFEGAALATFGSGIFLLFMLLGISYAVDTFVKWFYSVNIITDERIVDVDFSNILYHRYSEASIEQIQDVTHTVSGVLGSLFDYGTVYVQTAATRPEFEFQNVPRPREVQEVLIDIIEMNERNEL